MQIFSKERHKLSAAKNVENPETKLNSETKDELANCSLPPVDKNNLFFGLNLPAGIGKNGIVF